LYAPAPPASHWHAEQPDRLRVDITWLDDGIPATGWLVESTRAQAAGYVRQDNRTYPRGRVEATWVRLRRDGEQVEFGAAIGKFEDGRRYCTRNVDEAENSMDPDGTVTWTMPYTNCVVLERVRAPR